MFKGFRSIVAGGILAAATAGASADISGFAFQVIANSSDGNGSVEWVVEQMEYDQNRDTYWWELTTPVEITDDAGRTIAQINNGRVELQQDPVISLGFAVQAGGVDTTFTINTALLSFPTIKNAQGQAGAAFTLTDTDNNGATFTPALASGAAYTAQYNGQAPNGSLFADLVKSSFSVPAGKSDSVSENDPGNGYRAVGGDVNDMSATLKFTVSANDLASGTNSYEIVPEPATLALLALGSLVIRRR